jgi:hypothetical protein
MLVHWEGVRKEVNVLCSTFQMDGILSHIHLLGEFVYILDLKKI